MRMRPDGHIEEARNQVDQRGFSRAAGAYERQHFAGLDFEIDVVQNLVFAFFSRVGKAYVLKWNGVLKALQHGGVRLFLYVVFGVKEGEDRHGSAHRLLEAVVEVGELAHRIVELEEQDDESAEEAHRHAAVHDFIAPDEQEHGDGDGADGIHQR